RGDPQLPASLPDALPTWLHVLQQRRSGSQRRPREVTETGKIRDAEAGLQGPLPCHAVERSACDRSRGCGEGLDCAFDLRVGEGGDWKSTRLNSSHVKTSY